MPHMRPVKRKLYASRRKTYGKVKPVKQAKPEPRLQKPSTVELRSIYARLRKAASWQIVDCLAEAVQWYRRMVAYLWEAAVSGNPRARVEMLTRHSSLVKIGMKRDKMLKGAQVLKNADVRLSYLVEAIELYEEEVKKFKAKVPALKDSLKKGYKGSKKLDARRAQVEKKYDALLTTLEAASDLGVSLGAVPAIDGDIDFKYDQTLDKMLYSRSALKTLKKRIRTEGLLPVFLEQIFFIARSAAMREEAEYIVDDHTWVYTIGRGMKNLCKWLATNQDAPNRLIKRTVPKKKHPRKKTTADSIFAESAASMREMDKVFAERDEQQEMDARADAELLADD